jgi:hypothetical protein
MFVTRRRRTVDQEKIEGEIINFVLLMTFAYRSSRVLLLFLVLNIL